MPQTLNKALALIFLPFVVWILFGLPLYFLQETYNSLVTGEEYETCMEPYRMATSTQYPLPCESPYINIF